jgi:outer membrane protein assembly factor BamB
VAAFGIDADRGGATGPTASGAGASAAAGAGADYSDNRVVEVDAAGRVVFAIDEVFGIWDVEPVGDDQLLLTEFSLSRVSRVDRKGKVLWVYEDLKNPYDADLLQNGNVLIADSFAERVIEVDPRTNRIVWSLRAVTERGDGAPRTTDIRPFDVERLANGNTLIADATGDRVVEVDTTGTIVWQAKGCPNIHDADRLPNGNTLVTLRNAGRVLELDAAGKTVWSLTGLSSPSDADRLPNGNTLVAENAMAREFDAAGKEVWRKGMTWCVEVHRR